MGAEKDSRFKIQADIASVIVGMDTTLNGSRGGVVCGGGRTWCSRPWLMRLTNEMSTNMVDFLVGRVIRIVVAV